MIKVTARRQKCILLLHPLSKPELDSGRLRAVTGERLSYRKAALHRSREPRTSDPLVRALAVSYPRLEQQTEPSVLTYPLCLLIS